MNVLSFSKMAKFLNLFRSTTLREIEKSCLSSSVKIIIMRSETTSKKKRESSQRFRLLNLYTLGALDKAAHIQLSFYTLIMKAQCNKALGNKLTVYLPLHLPSLLLKTLVYWLCNRGLHQINISDNLGSERVSDLLMKSTILQIIWKRFCNL